MIKICGLRTPDTLEAAIAAGAGMVGLVHVPRSPRHVALPEMRALSGQARGRALRVLLTVDATDRDLDAAIEAARPDLLQLHGDETPERVAAIRARTGIATMKALGVSTAADLDRIERYGGAADRILLDARPPAGALLPGGNGVPFDWSLLADRTRRPGGFGGDRLMLSGGLTPENVADAIAITGIAAVDVSSGVESRPGEKDPARIAAFVRAAAAALAPPVVDGMSVRRVA